jgi:hypothetical protein
LLLKDSPNRAPEPAVSDTPPHPVDSREETRRQWLEHSASVFDRLFPQDADGPLPTFAALEQKTDNLARDLTCWLLQQRLNSDPLAAPRPEEPPGCPRCNRPGRLLGRADRPPPRRVLTTAAGDVEFRRAKYRCPACRVVFFPPR